MRITIPADRAKTIGWSFPHIPFELLPRSESLVLLERVEDRRTVDREALRRVVFAIYLRVRGKSERVKENKRQTLGFQKCLDI